MGRLTPVAQHGSHIHGRVLNSAAPRQRTRQSVNVHKQMDIPLCYSFYVRTFHVADLTLTVRPLLVRVHFIRRKKLLSVFGSLAFLEPEIKKQWQFKRGNKLSVNGASSHTATISCSLSVSVFLKVNFAFAHSSCRRTFLWLFWTTAGGTIPPIAI